MTPVALCEAPPVSRTGAHRRSFGRRVARGAVVGLVVLGLLSTATPARADFSIPGPWQALGLGAAASVVGSTVNAAVGVGEAAMVSVGGAVSSGITTAAGAVSGTAAADLALLEATWELPFVAEGAATAGACIGTAGIACVVGGALAAGAAGYGVYKLFHGSGSHPNSDLGASLGTSTYPSGMTQYWSWALMDPYAPNGLSYCTHCWGQGWYVPAGVTVTPGVLYSNGDCINLASFTGGSGGSNVTFYSADITGHGGGAPQIGYKNGSTGPCSGGSSSGPPPLRQLVTTRNCLAAGGSTTTVTATGPDFTEANEVAALSVTPACPAGTIPNGGRIDIVPKPGEAGSSKPLIVTAPAPSGTPTGAVEVYIKTDAGPKTCATNPSPCVDWWKAPSPGDTFECHVGATVVDLSECDGIRTRYNPPKTGVPTRPAGKNCDGGDFSLNPVSWVVVPLKCLFIPNSDVVSAQFARVGTAWAGTAPATAIGTISPIFDTFLGFRTPTGFSDCNGPDFAIPIPAVTGHGSRTVHIHPLSTCNPLVSMVLGWAMPVMSAMMYLGGFFGGIRIVTRSIGAGDGLGEPV